MKSYLIRFLLVQGLVLPNSWAKNLDAHVHGSVKLDIASDKNQLLVMMKSPSESFLGFEYEAKNKEDKALVEKVRNEWKIELIKYLGAQALNDCKITKSSWKQEFSGKRHSSIIAESYIQCDEKLSGRLLQVSFKKSYNNIHEVHLQLIREDGSVVSKEYKEDTFIIKI